ncbi:hypothetical protein J6590_093265, partial [Homalodisca vitripennis]
MISYHVVLGKHDLEQDAMIKLDKDQDFSTDVQNLHQEFDCKDQDQHKDLEM